MLAVNLAPDVRFNVPVPKMLLRLYVPALPFVKVVPSNEIVLLIVNVSPPTILNVNLPLAPVKRNNSPDNTRLPDAWNATSELEEVIPVVVVMSFWMTPVCLSLSLFVI